MEERKAQVGRRLIGRDAPIVVQDSSEGATGTGSQELSGPPPSAETGMAQSHEVNQTAVLRRQLAQDAALPHAAARPARKRAEKRDEGKAAKKGFG